MGHPGRIAYCDLCKRVVPRKSLIFRPVKYAMPLGMQNRLAYSFYAEGATPGWTTVGGTVDSFDSFGAHADPRWGIFDENNVYTMRMGCATFAGSMLVYQTAPIDVTGATSVCFRAMVGPWEQSHHPNLAVEMGFWESGVRYNATAWPLTVNCIKEVWFRVLVENITAPTKTMLRPYIAVVPATAGSKWWFEDASLEFNVDRPGAFLATAGVGLDSFGGPITAMAAVCPRCIEDIPDYAEWHPLEVPPRRYEGLDDILPEG